MEEDISPSSSLRTQLMILIYYIYRIRLLLSIVIQSDYIIISIDGIIKILKVQE
jgi:hypothetical protein